MKDNLSGSSSPEERAEMVLKEAMRSLDRKDPAGCVDDRGLAKLAYDDLPELVVRPEETAGPQMLGGAYTLFDIALETAPEEREVDFDTLYQLTLGAFTDAGYTMGIHMDDHHGEMGLTEIKQLLQRVLGGEDVEVPGCGYDGLVHSNENPLGLSEKSVQFHKKFPHRAAEFIRRGVRLSILGGQHAPRENAIAIINTQKNVTLNSDRAQELGQPTYNHDQIPFEELLNALAEIAERMDVDWAKNIRENGKELYGRWYNIVSNKLAGMAPIQK